MSVRVRFAPSPTGHLHVGGARTALFNYLFAKQQNGSFILRIEDTDQTRHQEKSLIPLLKNLNWLGLYPDEGFFINQHGSLQTKGSFAPYRQKDRLPIYRQYALKLINEGKAYYCFMSLEEQEYKKKQAIEKGQTWRVSSPYRNCNPEEAKQKIKKGIPACIRFKALQDKKNYFIGDLMRGTINFPLKLMEDFVLIRTNGSPVYNFSCAVDDSLMQISHIFRAEEHLSNSLKQKLIQESLGFKPPQIGHLSIILGSDKKKLSKRSGAKNIQYYRDNGYLPSALINFLALLGWNPGTTKEFFLIHELIQSFSLKNINLSAAIFDEKKSLWLNERHIKTLPDKTLLNLIQPFLATKKQIEKTNISSQHTIKQEAIKHTKTQTEELEKIVPALRSNFKTLKQAAKIIEPLLSTSDFILHESAKPVLKWPKSKSLIKKWFVFLTKNPDNLTQYINFKDFKAFQKNVQNLYQLNGKAFFMPIRCALTASPEGAEIKILINLLPKKELIKRAKATLKFTSSLEETLP